MARPLSKGSRRGRLDFVGQRAGITKPARSDRTNAFARARILSRWNPSRHSCAKCLKNSVKWHLGPWAGGIKHSRTDRGCFAELGLHGVMVGTIELPA